MSVLNKINELQDAFRKEYGVDAKIDIIIHGDNQDINHERANEIALDIAQNLLPESIWGFHNSQGNDGKVKWVTLDTKNNFDLSIFYNGPREAEKHAS